MRSPAHCTPCNAFVGAGFYPARGRGRAPPLRTARYTSVGAGVLDGPTGFFRTRQGTRALPYKALRYRGRADRVVGPYKEFRRGRCLHRPALPHPCKTPCHCEPVTDSLLWQSVHPASENAFPFTQKKGAPPPGRAPFQTDSIHQKSALPTVRGCSSTSRMLLTPVRYMTIRSKPRPKPACLQVP